MDQFHKLTLVLHRELETEVLVITRSMKERLQADKQHCLRGVSDAIKDERLVQMTNEDIDAVWTKVEAMLMKAYGTIQDLGDQVTCVYIYVCV